MRHVLLVGIVLCFGCSSDERSIEKAATWLCQQNMLLEPNADGLPEGQDLATYVDAEDLRFIDAQRREEALQQEGNPWAAMGESWATSITQATLPAVRAMREAMAAHTECEVRITMGDGGQASVAINRTVPELVGRSPLERLQDLASLGSHEERVEAAEGWYGAATSNAHEGVVLEFRESGERWRAFYGLERRAWRTELEAAERALETAQEELATHERLQGMFEVSSSSFELHRRRFLGPEPSLELAFRNRSEVTLTRAVLHGYLRTEGRAEPWISAPVSIGFEGGLGPGASDTGSYRPGFGSDWRTTSIPEGAVMTVEVVALEGADPIVRVRRRAEIESDIEDRRASIERLQTLLGG